MKKVVNAWREDMLGIQSKTLIKITLFLFCLIPSVYALSMIRSSWNPYAKTNMRRLPIAFVNDDQGVYSHGKNINIGNDIAKDLKRNPSVGWKFVNYWQGNNGLTNGKYYALIQIPSDFSQRITTTTSDNPQQVVLTYQINQKLNAAATKLSSEVESDLSEQVRQKLVHTQTKLIIKKMNSFSDVLSSNKEKLLNLNPSISSAIKLINREKNNLEDAKVDQSKAVEVASLNKRNLAYIQDDLNALLDSMSISGQISSKAVKQFKIIQDDILNNMESSKKLTMLLDNSSLDLNSRNEKAQVEQAQSINNESLKRIKALLQVIPNQGNTKLNNNLEKLESLLHTQKVELKQLSSNQLKSLRSQIATIEQTNDSIYSLYRNTMSKQADSMIANLNGQQSDVKSNIVALQRISSSIDNASTQKPGTKQINNAIDQLDSALSILKKFKSTSKFINKKNLDLIISVLKSSPNIAKVFANPVYEKKVNIYNLGLLGYGVTPFYTTLSIWVGILLITTIVFWEYTKFSTTKYLKLNRVQSYLGKLFLYLSLSFIQSTITLIGEIFILRIHPNSILGFIGVVYLTTLTFTVILFTLVYLFGNVGKVFGVLLMLIQIFGTGGIYPLEIIPNGLSNLANFLPFYYSINLFRDAIAGTINTSFVFNCIVLGDFIIVAFLIAPLHNVINSLINNFEDAFKLSNL
ncbi:YhgE/Pip domain-containing protein [Lactiplantibacillus plantarum]|uniref:YhgE/Pip domain-containing protein n=3 Tax=Lactiplantibacillus plantarum TaxID=1590 RepID=UPI001BA5833F|nr:YhgE/Pip domain-containing protein [Lactiplantibacillus plantarum]MBS0945852.1 YhgE/Pip domain-containing protein [Lactiplantibacillus plantarum]